MMSLNRYSVIYEGDSCPTAESHDVMRSISCDNGFAVLKPAVRRSPGRLTQVSMQSPCRYLF